MSVPSEAGTVPGSASAPTDALLVPARRVGLPLPLRALRHHTIQTPRTSKETT